MKTTTQNKAFLTKAEFELLVQQHVYAELKRNEPIVVRDIKVNHLEGETFIEVTYE